MRVMIGSARIDENSHLQGGQAGDQTGKEVSTQEFYIHKKGWMVLRPKDPGIADQMADAMRRACANDCIGYDQGNRLGIISLGIDTNCGTLVRRCIIEASGIDPGNFTTLNEVQVLAKTGLFYPAVEYKNGITNLSPGDVLVTKTKGHTAIVTEGKMREGARLPVSKEQQARFLAKIIPICQRQAAEHGYKLFPSVAIAQACLESAWGTAAKMVAANATMGVKVGKSAPKFGKAWHGAAYKTGTTEYYDGKNATRITDYFRQYDSVEDSVCDYMDMLLHCKRYRGAVDCRSPEESIEGIIKGDYATGPEYVASIKRIIKANNLTQFDTKGTIAKVCPYAMPVEDCNRTLKRGCRGETVKALQWCLNVLMSTKLDIDGNFGPMTESVLIIFQEKAGLEPDGKAGVKTWKKIRSML